MATSHRNVASPASAAAAIPLPPSASSFQDGVGSANGSVAGSASGSIGRAHRNMVAGGGYSDYFNYNVDSNVLASTYRSYFEQQDNACGPIASATSNGGLIPKEIRKFHPKRLWKQFAADTLVTARMTSARKNNPDDEGDVCGYYNYCNTTLAQQVRDDETMQKAAALAVDMKNMVAKKTMPIEGSLGAAIFGLIKGTVGPGILYLPRGFQNSGYGVAIPSMIIATILYVYNSNRLLDCWYAEKENDYNAYLLISKYRPTSVTHFQEMIRKEHQEKGIAQQQPTPFSRGQQRDQEKDGLMKMDSNVSDMSKYSLPPDISLPMLTYPELAKRAFGPRLSMLVDMGIAMLQYGVCLTYLIFVPHNLHETVETLFGLNVSKTKLLWFMVAIEIPLCFIRDIKKLTPTNVIATGLISYGLCFVILIAMYQGLQWVYPDYDEDDYFTKDNYNNKFTMFDDDDYYVMDDAPVVDEAVEERRGNYAFVFNFQRHMPFFTDAWFLFVGTSFFMMEGSITLLVPLHESLSLEKDQKRFPYINGLVTFIIVIFFVVFSLVCCGGFGNSIHTALTASLGDGFFATSIQLAYSVAVILTFPLQAFPATEVIKSNILGSSEKRGNITSTLIVIGLGVMAIYSIDYLGNVVSILGSLFGIPLALIFPPLMHNITMRKSRPHEVYTLKAMSIRITNYIIVLIGFVGMGVSSYATISSWDEGAE